jgi:hypothetical protein
MGDLLVQARRRRIRQLSACSGGHLNVTTGQNHHRRSVDQGLVSGGFEQIGNRGKWYSSHPGSSVLDAADAPSALIAAVNDDITLVAKSRILREDLASPLPKNLRRAKSKPWGE